ncbi:MAG: TatD family hydrolase [Desulfurococcales archaeon]|nr:TatD family hydrolase [Desulfurococcales archaeon]
MAGRLYDMHCHCSEFEPRELGAILEGHPGLVVVAVSEDVESLLETIGLAHLYPGRLVPCAGFHPWVIGERPLSQLEEVLRLAYRHGIACLGEVGLDRKFVPHTWEAQVQVFTRILREARDTGALVNIHAPDAWRDALALLLDYEVERAFFHWYTGPLDLIPAIGEAGYKVSINAAIRIQKKHQRVAAHTPLEYMVTESDGPYNYRGLRLSPAMIPETIKVIAEVKGVDPQEVEEAARRNAERLLATVKP